jgi:LysM repeat protein
MAAEAFVAVAVVIAIAGGLLAIGRRGGSLTSPESQPDRLISRLPTDVPTFTPRPPSSPTRPPNTLRPPTATPLPAVITHTVAGGDTLYGIAQAYGVTLDAITEANAELRENPNRLSIGQQLRIPVAQAEADESPLAAAPASAPTGASEPAVASAAGAGAAEPPAEKPSAAQAITQALAMATHEVVAGETITEVADAYSMTVSDLVILNPAVLGERPALPPVGAAITVRIATAISGALALAGQPAGASALGADKSSASVPREDLAQLLLPAPVLLSPGDGATVTSSAPLLRWSSVGILAPGAFYVVALRDASRPDARPRLIWVSSNANALQLPGDVRPAIGSRATIAWSVSVRRTVSRLFGPDEGVAVSSEAPWRSFIWAP